VAVLAAACGDGPTGSRPPSLTTIAPEWVTGAAAAAVGPDGRFIFDPVTPASMSVARAESLSIALASFIGDPNTEGNTRAQIEDSHGGRIDFRGLRLCGRRFYIRPVVAPPPPNTRGYLLRYFAPQWIVPLCDQGVPAVTSEIPDAPSAMSLADGHISFSDFTGGNDFWMNGSPPGFEEGLPLSPEQAVKYAVTVMGRRVAQVPDGWIWHALNPNYAPWVRSVAICARWRLTLDGATRLRGDSTGTIYDATEVYVHRAPVCGTGPIRLELPLATQPLQWPVEFHPDTTSTRDTLQLSIIGPVRFETVTVVPE
jgi:hypothetical protein